MEQWDIDQISSTFRCQALEAERYCNEVKYKIKSNPSYESIYDEHIAKFHVYNYLHGKRFLSSRDQLLEELHGMLSCEVTPYEYYDLDRFEKYRQDYINSEICKFKNT